MATESENKYKQFLNYLSLPKLQSCSCHSRIHPRIWIPPPCLATKSLAETSVQGKFLNRLSYSSPDLSVNMESVMDSTECDEDSSSSDSDHENLISKLEATKREKKILQDALQRYDCGEKLPKATKLLIHKWKSKLFSKQFPKKHTQDKILKIKERKLPSKTEIKLLGELEQQFMNLSSKEKKQLFDKKDTDEQVKDSEVCICDELHRKKVRTKTKKNPEASFRCYKYSALKRKYEDLQKYLLKTESENNLLKKENKALHGACEEYGRTAEFKKQISHLECEVSKLKAYVSKCEGELYHLRSKNDKLKSESQKQEERMANELPLERELSLLKNLNDTKIFYEKAIDSYKKELTMSNLKIRELQEQQGCFINEWENKETMMIQNFEKQIDDLKEKLQNKMSKPDDSNNRKHLIKLEKLLNEKEIELKTLKQQLRGLKNSMHKPEYIEKQVLDRFEELLNQVGTGFSAMDKTAFLDSVKETVNHCFCDLKQSGQLVDSNDGNKKLKLEYEKLSERLKEKTLEAQTAKNELKENKEKLESFYTNLEAKSKEEAGFAEGLDALKQLPEMLKYVEAKLSKTEESQKKLAIDNRLLIERLERTQNELSFKDEQIQAFEERFLKQNERLKNFEKDAEKSEIKIENLQKMVERKDEILERNSTQLEDRIRTCAAMNAQIEKLKDNHNEEVRTLKTQAKTQDSYCHSKLVEIQTEKAKMEVDYAALKSERSNLEKTYKRQLKALEEQIEHLNFKNNTIQRQLDTFSSTYKTLFSFTGETS